MDRIRIFKADEIFDDSLQFKIYRHIGKMNKVLHTHDYIQMWYVASGACIHRYREESYHLVPGDVFILPPGVPHAMFVEDNTSVIWDIEFTPGFISDAFDRQNGDYLSDYQAYIRPFLVASEQVKPFFTLRAECSKYIERLLEETLQEFNCKNEQYPLFIRANVLKILAIVTREYGHGIDFQRRRVLERNRAQINEALRYIKLHYTSHVYLSDVCEITKMSPARFSMVFKSATGMTLSEYVLSLRIERAKDCLIRSDDSISNIADICGFYDSAAFGRAFKRAIGISPLKYRKFYKIIQKNEKE